MASLALVEGENTRTSFSLLNHVLPVFDVFAMTGVLACIDLGSLKANSNFVLLLQIL